MYKINNKNIKYPGQDKDVPFLRWENQLKIYMFEGVPWRSSG